MQLWIAGRDAEIEWLPHVLLETSRATRGLHSVATLGPLDYLVVDKYWNMFVDALTRLAAARGHRAAPTSGVGVVVWLELLSSYRELIGELSLDKQKKVWPAFRDMLFAGLREAGGNFVLQLDQIEPLGRHVDGYLPDSSVTTGAFNRLKKAIRGITRMRSQQVDNPGLFGDVDGTAGSKGVTSWSVIEAVKPGKG